MEGVLIEFGSVDPGPLRLTDIGVNQCYWSSRENALFDLLALEGYELVIRKYGRRIEIVRRKIAEKLLADGA